MPEITVPANWVITTTPPPRKRSPEVQLAYDFFWNLPIGTSVLIPKDEASIARNAVALLKAESQGAVEIRFRAENDTQVRATKHEDYSPEDKARIGAEDGHEPAADATPGA